MVLTTNWHLILALGFCLAFLLLPWIARYPQTLQLRSAFFIASQCAIFLFFLATPAPEYIYLLAFLVVLRYCVYSCLIQWHLWWPLALIC